MVETLEKKELAPSADMIAFIERKRKGLEHSADEINWFINNLSNFPDYQISAWLMAVCTMGLSNNETTELTRAMAYSGHVLTLRRHEEDIARGYVDKHSTGGVGDKVTLVLMPILASLGFKVSKFSGRALGHTGGTIDKLESIPGFETDISMKRLEKQIAQVGIALAGQTAEFAPADKKLYALRDITGTVDSIPLIASSIMSKKIAAGAEHILLDVKLGSGAFMKDLKYAKELAKLMVKIGKDLNLDTKAIISNMDQPLGKAIGNALEVEEALKVLAGDEKGDLYDLVQEFAASISSSIEVEDAIRSGKAYIKFQEWVEAQGGNFDEIKNAANAKYKLEVKAEKAGWVSELDALKIGQAVHKLAYKATESGYDIDHSAGVVLNAKIGDPVSQGDTLFVVQANSEDGLEIARDEILNAYLFAESKVKKPKLIIKKI